MILKTLSNLNHVMIPFHSILDLIFYQEPLSINIFPSRVFAVSPWSSASCAEQEDENSDPDWFQSEIPPWGAQSRGQEPSLALEQTKAALEALQILQMPAWPAQGSCGGVWAPLRNTNQRESPLSPVPGRKVGLQSFNSPFHTTQVLFSCSN